MESQDTLRIDLDKLGSKPEKQCTGITEVVRNLESYLDGVIKSLKDHKVSKIILRNGKPDVIEEEGEEYERMFESLLKVIKNSRHLRHVELKGITVNPRFIKDLMRLISKLRKTKRIKLSFGI